MNTFKTADDALARMAEEIMTKGDELGSRQGERVMERLHREITLEEPWKREILNRARRASLPAQIAETMWVLSGRNDIGWLEHYLPRAKDFSDDGRTWRGGYGPRLRAWVGRDHDIVIDQLRHVIDLLKQDPTTRRATMSIYDPDIDTRPGKDIPCNNWITFDSRLGKLHMHVAIRSNDLIWGWSGINQFEWSALQEIVAGILGVRVGNLHFSIASLHIYDRHWKKADDVFRAAWEDDGRVAIPDDSPRFDGNGVSRDIEALGRTMDEWFRVEKRIRLGESLDDDLTHMIEDFPEPMMRSWLWVLAWWWHRMPGDAIPPEIAGTRLEYALKLSPGRPASPLEDTEESLGAQRAAAWRPDIQETPAGKNPVHFNEFVSKLHEEKSAVYGDSWKRRGEQIGIMANIARKVDRLGQSGGGDTAADTVIDMLVYMIKYENWLGDDIAPDTGVVTDRLIRLGASDLVRNIEADAGTASLIGKLRQEFDTLEAMVTEGAPDATKRHKLHSMIASAYVAAFRLWKDEA